MSIPGTAGVVVGLPPPETARLQLGEGNLADDRVALWGIKGLELGILNRQCKCSLGKNKYLQEYAMRVSNGSSAHVLTIYCGSLAIKATRHGLVETGVGWSGHSNSGM